MTRKRFSEDDLLGILRQIDLDLASGGTVETAVVLLVSVTRPIISGGSCMAAWASLNSGC